MTTTIQHIDSDQRRLTIVRGPNGTVAMPGLLGAAEAMRYAGDHFARIGALGNAEEQANGVAALGKPVGRMHPKARPGMAMQGKFKVTLPQQGHLWIARKFKVPSDMLSHANPHIRKRAWRGRTILDLAIGDVVFVPTFVCPPGSYFDPNMAECRKQPCAPGTVWSPINKTCTWPQRGPSFATMHAARNRSLSAGESCTSDGDCGWGEICFQNSCISDNKLSTTVPDGAPCTFNYQCANGNCDGGICGGQQPIQPGVATSTNPDNCPGLPGYDPNAYSGANCPDDPNAATNCSNAGGHWSYPYGGTHGVCDCGPGMVLGSSGGVPTCQTMPGVSSGPCAGKAEGDACIDDAGTPGGTCIGGNCVQGANCGTYQHKDASGLCVDDPCPPCTDRSGPGAECYATTAATCSGVFDPGGPGGECCFNNCGANEHYDMQWHSCYCDTGYVRDANTGDCVVATTPPPACGANTHPDSNGNCVPDKPPPHVDPCQKAPDGTQMVSYAGAPCVKPEPTCPGGGKPDADGKCPPTPPPAAGGGKSSSGIGLVIGALAVATAVGVGLAINKKNKKHAHAR